MKTWIPFAFTLLALLLSQGSWIISAPSESPTPHPPIPEDSPELTYESAIHCPLGPEKVAGSIQSMAFTPDGQSILAANIQGAVRVFDARSGRPTVSFRPAGRGSLCGIPVAFAPDGKAIAAPIDTGQWALFNPATGKLIRPMEPHPGILARTVRYAVAFSPDGKRLAGAYENGEVVLWDVASGRRLRALPPYIRPEWTSRPLPPYRPAALQPAAPQKVTALAFSPDGATLYTVGYAFRAWDVAATTEPRRIELPDELPCGAMAVCPDGKTLAAAIDTETINAEPHAIFLIDAATGRKKAEITTTTRAIRGLAFRPGGRELVSLEGERVIRLWDVAQAKPIAACRFERHFELEHLEISPDGRRIAAGGQESDAIFGVIGMVETDGTKLGPWRPTNP